VISVSQKQTGISVHLVPGHSRFILLSLSFSLYLVSYRSFLLGAGRECEGKNHKEREDRSFVAHSPLSLRFSPSRSLFPYPHLSKLRIAFRKRSEEEKGIRKAGAQCFTA